MKLIEADADIFKIKSRKLIEVENNKNFAVLLKIYAEKFKDAAYKLVEYLRDSNDIEKLDEYFFSIAYLYRHSIELVLKAIAFKYIIETEDRVDFLKMTKHNLLDILIKIKPFIEMNIKVDEDSFNWLLALFSDINDIDRESDSFRYPFRIGYERNLFGEKIFTIHPVFMRQTHIDLIKFGDKMLTAYCILDSLYKNIYGKYERNEKLKPILIEEGGRYYGQSVVGYKYNFKEFYPYVNSYTYSGNYLYKLICENEVLKNDLFIPMCYLYRNAVEISLKETLFEECSYGLQEVLKRMNKKKHKVLGLWNLIKNEIKDHANPPKGDKTMNNVFNYISQLNSADSDADIFRYPFSKNLSIYFKRKRIFDIDNVNEFFEELLSFLSGINLMISDHNEILAEMKA